jgi:hypothetical protein
MISWSLTAISILMSTPWADAAALMGAYGATSQESSSQSGLRQATPRCGVGDRHFLIGDYGATPLNGFL